MSHRYAWTSRNTKKKENLPIYCFFPDGTCAEILGRINWFNVCCYGFGQKDFLEYEWIINMF